MCLSVCITTVSITSTFLTLFSGKEHNKVKIIIIGNEFDGIAACGICVRASGNCGNLGSCWSGPAGYIGNVPNLIVVMCAYRCHSIRVILVITWKRGIRVQDCWGLRGHGDVGRGKELSLSEIGEVSNGFISDQVGLELMANK